MAHGLDARATRKHVGRTVFRQLSDTTDWGRRRKAVGEKMFWGGLVLRFRWKVRVLLQLPKLAILDQQ